MAEIIKTWPRFMEPSKVRAVFTHDWGTFYFSLGRAAPKRDVTKLWFTHRGILLGNFDVDCYVRNDGSLPKLRSISNHESPWQFKPDVWIAICKPPIHWLESKVQVFHESFRGWRYFDFPEYVRTNDAKIRLERA